MSTGRGAGLERIVDALAPPESLLPTEKACARQIEQEHADQRREIVAALREHGHSLRAIAGAVGVDAATVHRDAASSGVAAATPDEVRGLDGKRYPARQAPERVKGLALGLPRGGEA